MMKSKRFLMVMTLLLIEAGVNAQKIDQRLTCLIEKSDTRSMSAIATLKKGEEYPTEQLEQIGIEIRYQIGDMVVLNVPADKLLQLENVEAFSYIEADEIMSKINKGRKYVNK